MDNLFESVILSDNKTVDFIEQRLRSALDIVKEGGHVTMTYSDKTFRLQYDNRRIIQQDGGTLFDSLPVTNYEMCKKLRFLGSLSKTKHYYKYDSTSKSYKYRNTKSIAIRSFIRGLLASPPKFNLCNDFTSYQEIIDFIRVYDPSFKITKAMISNLKNRNPIPQLVPRDDETLAFVEYIKGRYPLFDESSYFMK